MDATNMEDLLVATYEYYDQNKLQELLDSAKILLDSTSTITPFDRIKLLAYSSNCASDPAVTAADLQQATSQLSQLQAGFATYKTSSEAAQDIQWLTELISDIEVAMKADEKHETEAGAGREREAGEKLIARRSSVVQVGIGSARYLEWLKETSTKVTEKGNKDTIQPVTGSETGPPEEEPVQTFWAKHRLDQEDFEASHPPQPEDGGKGKGGQGKWAKKLGSGWRRFARMSGCLAFGANDKTVQRHANESELVSRPQDLGRHRIPKYEDIK